MNTHARGRTDPLSEVERRVLWLSTAIAHHANRVRPNPSGLKVGGHQASSASLVSMWALLACLGQLGRPGGSSAYLRLSTRPVDQGLASVPADPAASERRRRQVVAGGYLLRRAGRPDAGRPSGNSTGSSTTAGSAAKPDVTIVAMGVLVPEALAAASRLEAAGLAADVVCATSPGLLFRALRARQGHGGGPD